jgi:hypothetical protein
LDTYIEEERKMPDDEVLSQDEIDELVKKHGDDDIIL